MINSRCVYDENHCDYTPLGMATHPYCSAWVNSAFCPLWDMDFTVNINVNCDEMPNRHLIFVLKKDNLYRLLKSCLLYTSDAADE